MQSAAHKPGRLCELAGRLAAWDGVGDDSGLFRGRLHRPFGASLIEPPTL